ncbi:MAG: hypothetical protein HOE93_04230 [Nitrosopumilus sp.]|jgi:hypothetical protein|nr:hypothetical protein [Nitrosopumilus sp.]MBT3573950.1 hypothetical protein [Nitrosopumilus sp.]MBT3861926.1 hypothetical protein [Nitrosopumilus sp.]MBT3956506.1 hypothetical protein [Nitrosopumilus sp.]MBT4299222.1 hypothetical protein [Nitrosopumilus sp.]
MLSEKGKYASATENRRFVWAEIIWPLILEINDITFSLKQFQDKREKVCEEKNTTITIASRGLVSLMLKGIILKEKNLYSIHYKLIPYMRLKAKCDYATAIHEVRIK